MKAYFFYAGLITLLLRASVVHAALSSVEEIYHARKLGERRQLFDIITSGSIMQCIDTGSDMDCTKKLHVTGALQNGESDGTGVLLFSLTHMAEGTPDGLALSTDPFERYTVADEISVVITQSAIRLSYPITYAQDFNDKPYETIFDRDASGRSFSLVNRCEDAPTAENPGCGWVWRTGADGEAEKVPFSQGFCCNCEIVEALSGSHVPRSGAQCNIFAGRDTAHCLSYSPLWYSAYEIGPPSIDFEIRLLIIRCRPEGTAQPEKCDIGVPGCVCEEFDTTFHGKELGLPPLGPKNPSYCFSFPGNENTTSCDIQFELIGTFAPYEGYADFSNKRLLIPVHCAMSLEDAGPLGMSHPCFQKVLGNSDRWLIVETTDISTDGSQCNKIGTSYEAFASQGRACEHPKDTCLAMQIRDLYDSDVNRLNQGQQLKYFLQGYREQTAVHPVRGLPYFEGGIEKVQELITNRKQTGFSLVFPTQRFQKSLVSLNIRADEGSFRYTLQVSDGAIIFLNVPTFEAGKEGRLQILAENTGHVASKYTLAVACDEGILPLQARQVNLLPQSTPGYEQPLPQEWKVYTTNISGDVYNCTVSLSNALGHVIHSHAFTISTTDQEPLGGGEDIDEDRDRTDGGSVDQDSTPAYSVCGEKCSSFLDLGCALRSGSACASRVAGLVGGGVGLLAIVGIAAVVAIKYPFVYTAAYRMVCRNGDKKEDKEHSSKKNGTSKRSTTSDDESTDENSDDEGKKRRLRSDRSAKGRRIVRNPLQNKKIRNHKAWKNENKEYEYQTYLQTIRKLNATGLPPKDRRRLRKEPSGRAKHDREETRPDAPWQVDAFPVLYPQGTQSISKGVYKKQREV